MDQQELAATYRTFADEELVRLAADTEGLTEDARCVLAAEMAVRGIGDRDVDKVHKWRLWESRKNERREAEHWFELAQSGRRVYGRANRSVDPITGAEEFTTTLFYTAAYLPVVPIASYRVKRRKGWNREVRDIQKLSLDWDQVLRVWCAAGLVVLAAIWAFKLLAWALR